ncbi:hypothetical protein BKA82DRAFT_4355028 [Pisolithus tinctorius]|nr:hypothetical protein BKA82DRAFT_4355028 [Pisolithus tinctorius]
MTHPNHVSDGVAGPNKLSSRLASLSMFKPKSGSGSGSTETDSSSFSPPPPPKDNAYSTSSNSPSNAPSAFNPSSVVQDKRDAESKKSLFKLSSLGKRNKSRRDLSESASASEFEESGREEGDEGISKPWNFQEKEPSDAYGEALGPVEKEGWSVVEIWGQDHSVLTQVYSERVPRPSADRFNNVEGDTSE